MGVVDRVSVDEDALRRARGDTWFLDVPAIAQVRRAGLELDPAVTVIVGENGSGKSTLVEGIALRWAATMTAAVKHWSPKRGAEDSELSHVLELTGERPRPQGGCFLRAESMHELFDDLDAGRGHHEGATRAFGGRLNTRSHGESFLAFLESRLDERGLFVLDEPEAALSFTSCLRLLALLGAVVEAGSQVVLATHSPVLAAYPGATILEFGDHGIRTAEWDELELTGHWREFLNHRESYLRHLF